MGALSSLPAERLAAHIVRAVVERSGIDPARIDDVIFAQSYSNSEAPCIGRWAALAADLPIEVPGCQIDRRCGGGLQAIVNAAMMVQTGAADVVLAGGVESMSNIEHYTQGVRRGMGIGPVPAVAKLFERTHLTWDDVDLIEINEAFAAQVLAVLKGWGFGDRSRINVNGSGISLGHPIGCTGLRILTTLLYEMRRSGARRGLETLCIGGGQGIAALFERP